jgi:photosystem II stability/assembly factor-like uncharacterized protein
MMRTTLFFTCLFMLHLSTQAQFKPLHTPFVPTAFSAYSPSKMWAVSQISNGGYQLQRSSNGGQSWIASNPPSTLSGATLGIGFFPVDSNNIWLYYQLHPSYNEFLYKSSDGGLSWTNNSGTLPENESWFFLYFFDTQNGVMLTRDFSSHVFVKRTTNGGNTWTSQTLTVQGSPLGAAVVGNTVWFFTGSGKLWRSNNRGLDWTNFDTGFTNAQGYGLRMSFRDSLYGLAAVNAFANDMVVTHDGGVTWSPLLNNNIPLPGPQAFLYSLTAIPGSPDGWLMGTSKGCAYTIDAGQNWILESNYPDYLLGCGTPRNQSGMFAFGYGAGVGDDYVYIWDGPFDGQNHCVQILDTIGTELLGGICKEVKVRLKMRADISNDTSLDVRYSYKFNPTLPEGSVQNILTGSQNCTVEFSPDPGQTTLGTLQVEIPIDYYDTAYIQQLKLAPTGCPTQAAPTVKFKAGYWANWFHDECFSFDSSNCAIKLLTNVCGADTNKYDIYYYVPSGSLTLGDTYMKNPAYHELVTFYITEKGVPFTWNSCFKSLSTLYTCGVSGTDTAPLNDTTVTLSPNPSNGISRVEWPREWGSDLVLGVSDAAGSKVNCSIQMQGETAILDASGLQKGLYFIHFFKGSKPVFVKKWVVTGQ